MFKEYGEVTQTQTVCIEGTVIDGNPTTRGLVAAAKI
jgi:hypothetical protein